MGKRQGVRAAALGARHPRARARASTVSIAAISYAASLRGASRYKFAPGWIPRGEAENRVLGRGRVGRPAHGTID